MSKRIAILATNGFEDAELIYPYYRLREAGHDVELISLDRSIIKGKNGYPMAPDLEIDDVDEEKLAEFDGIVIPGGTNNPDYLRRSKKVLDFVNGWFLAS